MRKTRDLCQTDWMDANPGEYFPDGNRWGVCSNCGDETFVSRSWIEFEAKDEPVITMDPRTWDDEKLDSSVALVSRYIFMGTPEYRSDLPKSSFGEWADKVNAEAARRAEIRINRGEYGEKHDASWYESRQTEEQFLSEIGA